MKAFVSEKMNFKTLVLPFKFPGRRHLENLGRNVGALLFQNKRSLCQNNRATTSRHKYSSWRRPWNLKAKTSAFEIHFFRIQTLSLEEVWKFLIAHIMFCGLSYFVVSVGVPFKVTWRPKWFLWSSSSCQLVAKSGWSDSYKALSHGVTVAMLVSQNKEMVAMMVYKTNPPGIELYANNSFVSVIQYGRWSCQENVGFINNSWP